MKTFTSRRIEVSHTFSYLIFNIVPYGKGYYYPHLTNEETED